MWFKDPKSDTQATTLMITVIVAVLGLLVSIASIIVPFVQGSQSLVQGNLGLTQAEINNDYVRLAWCQALPERLRDIVWCSHHLTPDTFDDVMRNDKHHRDLSNVSKYSTLLSPDSQAALEKYLIASGFRDGHVASLAAIESAVGFLHITLRQRGALSTLDLRRTSSWSRRMLSQMIVLALASTQWLIHFIDLRDPGKETKYAIHGLFLSWLMTVFQIFLGYSITSNLGLVSQSLGLVQFLVTSQCLEPSQYLPPYYSRRRNFVSKTLALLVCVTITKFTIDSEHNHFTWSHCIAAWIPTVHFAMTKLGLFQSVLLSYVPAPWQAAPEESENPHDDPHPVDLLRSPVDLKGAHAYLRAREAYRHAHGILLQTVERELDPDKQQLLKTDLELFVNQTNRRVLYQKLQGYIIMGEGDVDKAREERAMKELARKEMTMERRESEERRARATPEEGRAERVRRAQEQWEAEEQWERDESREWEHRERLRDGPERNDLRRRRRFAFSSSGARWG